MAQLITNVCDLCQIDGKEREEAVSTEQIQHGRRAIVVDVCEEHREFLTQTLEPFFAAGRRPDRDQTFFPKPARISMPASADHACDQEGCTRSFTTLQGLSMHKTRSHNMPSEVRDESDRQRDRVRNAETRRARRRDGVRDAEDMQEIDLVGAK